MNSGDSSKNLHFARSPVPPGRDCGVSERIRLCPYLENRDSLSRFSGTAGSFNFNPNLAEGYRRITELEDDLVNAPGASS